MPDEREKRIWKELAKDGIHNEKELDAAIKNMKLLNECIDITEAKENYKKMLLTLLKMKYRLKKLKGGKQ